MHSKRQTEKQFRKLEAKRFKLFERLETLNNKEKILLPAENNGWSIVQIMMHLAKAELTAYQYARKKLLYPDRHEKEKTMSLLKFKFTLFLLRLPIKYKAPSVVQIKETETMTYEELKNYWREVRSNFKALIDETEKKHFESTLFKHYFFGKVDLYHAFVFMGAHLERHEKQIRKLMVRELPEKKN